jgi:hypothetical protein
MLMMLCHRVGYQVVQISCLSKVLVVNKDNVVLDFIQVGYSTDVSTLFKGLPIKIIYHFWDTTCRVIVIKNISSS